MDVFDLSAKLTLDTSDYTSGIQKSEKQGKSFADKLSAKTVAIGQTLGNFATKAVTSAGSAIKEIVQGSIDAYADYEQLVGGVETLFGAGGKSLKEYLAEVGDSKENIEEYNNLIAAQETVLANADKAYKTAGLSANEYMETATSFAASLVSSLGGDTTQAAQYADMAVQDMADNANKMGTDISMIQSAYQGFAKQNYTMLDNLKLGYGGTKTEMERLLTDAFKITGKKYDISNLADIYEAIHVIQDEMGITGTTAKEAEGTISGSIASLKASWENLLTAFGDPNADLSGRIDETIDSLKIVVKNLFPVFKRVLTSAWASLKQAASKLPGLVFGTKEDGSIAWPTWDDVKAKAEEVWESIKTKATDLGGIVFGKKEDGSVDWPTWDDVKAKAKSIWGKIKSKAQDLAGLVFGKKGDGTVAWPTWDDVKVAAGTAWGWIKDQAKNLSGLVFGTKQDGAVDWPTWDDVKAKAAEIWESIKAKAAELGGLIFGKKEDGSVDWPTWDDVKAKAEEVWGNIKTGARNLAGLVFGTAEDGAVEWPDISAVMASFNTWWDGTAKPAIQNAAKWTLRLFGMPEESASSLATLISGWWDPLKDAAEKAINWALNIPELPYDAGAQLHDIIVEWWGGIKENLQSLLGWALGLPESPDATGMIDSIREWWDGGVKPFLSDILNFTLGLFGLPSAQEMVNAINTWWQEVKTAVGTLVMPITTTFNNVTTGIQNGWNDFTNWLGFGSGGSTSSGTASSHGFAKGLWSVPYDDFTANLHRGEMVLTASQAREYRSGNGGMADVSAIAQAVENAIRTGMEGVSVRSFLNGKDITDEVSRNTIKQLKARRYAT